jgi:hypothetical protein
MKPFYKAWQVFEINEPEDYVNIKQRTRDNQTIFYVDGLDAKVVTVYANDDNTFPVAKAEEALWDIFGEPCLYLSNTDFRDFVDTWQKFLEVQQQFWFQFTQEHQHKVNVSLMRKAMISMGSYKLLQSKKANNEEKWDEEKLQALVQLLKDVYKDLADIKLTVWGTSERLLSRLRVEGIKVQVVDVSDQSNSQNQLIASADEVDGLIILNDCELVRCISLPLVLEKMKQRFVFDTCYVYEAKELELLGARLLYC